MNLENTKLIAQLKRWKGRMSHALVTKGYELVKLSDWTNFSTYISNLSFSLESLINQCGLSKVLSSGKSFKSILMNKLKHTADVSNTKMTIAAFEGDTDLLYVSNLERLPAGTNYLYYNKKKLSLSLNSSIYDSAKYYDGHLKIGSYLSVTYDTLTDTPIGECEAMKITHNSSSGNDNNHAIYHPVLLPSIGTYYISMYCKIADECDTESAVVTSYTTKVTLSKSDGWTLVKTSVKFTKTSIDNIMFRFLTPNAIIYACGFRVGTTEDYTDVDPVQTDLLSFAFNNCSSLLDVDISDYTDAISLYSAFQGCKNLLQPDLSKFTKAIDISNLFMNTNLTIDPNLLPPSITSGICTRWTAAVSSCDLTGLDIVLNCNSLVQTVNTVSFFRGCSGVLNSVTFQNIHSGFYFDIAHCATKNAYGINCRWESQYIGADNHKRLQLNAYYIQHIEFTEDSTLLSLSNNDRSIWVNSKGNMDASTRRAFIEQAYDWNRNPDNYTPNSAIFNDANPTLSHFTYPLTDTIIAVIKDEYPDGEIYTYIDGDGNSHTFTDILEYFKYLLADRSNESLGITWTLQQ